MALLELPLRRSIAPTGVLRFSLTSPQRWSALTLTMQNSHSTRSAKVGSGQCTGSSEQTLFSLKDKFFSSEYDCPVCIKTIHAVIVIYHRFMHNVLLKICQKHLLESNEQFRDIDLVFYICCSTFCSGCMVGRS